MTTLTVDIEVTAVITTAYRDHLKRLTERGAPAPEDAGEILVALWDGREYDGITPQSALLDWCVSYVPSDILIQAFELLIEQEAGRRVGEVRCDE